MQTGLQSQSATLTQVPPQTLNHRLGRCLPLACLLFQCLCLNPHRTANVRGPGALTAMWSPSACQCIMGLQAGWGCPTLAARPP